MHNQGNNPLALLCIGDVIAILTLATVVIFLSLLIKLFLKQKPPKQHFKMLFLIRFGNIWSIKIFENFWKNLRFPHLCRAISAFML